MRKFFKLIKLILFGLFAVVFLLSLSACNTEKTAPSDESSAPDPSDKPEDAASAALTYYVSSGAKNGNGSKEAPFGSIQEAAAAIKALEALPAGGIDVIAAEGTYYIPDGITLDTSNSGTQECPIRYISDPKAPAVLTGGVDIPFADFSPLSAEEKERIIDKNAAERIIKVDLKQYGLTAADWGKLYARGGFNTSGKYDNGTGPAEAELFFDGERMTLSRYPNADYLRTGKIIDNGDALETYENGTQVNEEYFSMRNPRGGTFVYGNEGDAVTEHIKAWKTYDDVWVFGFFMWDWADSSTPIAAIDLEAKTLTTAYSSCYGFTSNARYYFYNVFEETDMPGEYYIDRVNGILYLYPTESENPHITISATLNSLVTLSDCKYLTFDGFTFKAARSSGFNINGSNVTVKNCLMENIRTSAINISGENNTVSGCTIQNIGTDAIIINGGDVQTLTPSNNLIINNKITRWSQIQRAGCGAVRFGGCGNVISHNEMSDAPNLAIEGGGNNNIIEYNEIGKVCVETSDCGAIYSGRSYTWYGNIYRYNYIHDVGTGTASANGIYWDDNLSGQIAYGNIIQNCTGAAFLIGGGRDNKVYNNLMVDCNTVISYDIRGWEGTFNNGWYGNPMQEGTAEMNSLKSVPYKGELWTAAFPTLAKVITDPNSTDRDNPDLVVNPSNCVIKNNAVYGNSSNIKAAINARVFDFAQEAEAPVKISDYYIDDFNENDFTFEPKYQALFSKLPDFEPFDFSKIGIEP